jgi:hypothetical protein
MIASAPSAEHRHADVPWLSPENYPVTGHIRRRAVHANGLDFPILEAGNGPLVLCLHGFPDHAQSWIPSREKDIGRSHPRYEDIGSAAPHPMGRTAPWRQVRTY